MKGSRINRSWDHIVPDKGSFTPRTERWSIHALESEDILTEYRYTYSDQSTANTPSSSSRSLRNSREVAEIQARYQRQQDEQKAWEKAHGRVSTASRDITPLKRVVYFKSVQELIEEIAMLELEITNLEQHLLGLYRQAFNQRSAPSPSLCERPLPVESKSINGEALLPQSSHRCYVDWQGSPRGSSLWNRAANDTSKEKHASYSQPISLTQGTAYLHNYRNGLPSKELRTQVESFTAYEANRLSEDIVLCMAAIYRRLAEPQLPQHEAEVSPSSSFSTSTFSAQESSTNGTWTSQRSEESSHTGSYNDVAWRNIPANAGRVDASVFEVKSISIDDERLVYIATMLRTFQSLVQQLESIDPGQLGHEQKLAFWINIHNALMMHAYLAYGIPRSQSKRVALFQKAAYRIGVHSLNAQTIQRRMLRCKSCRPTKWLHSIVLPASTKKQRGAERQSYAIQNPEPLLCFALSCGARSDPAVRIYTPRFIYEELEVAKQDFLSAYVSIYKGGKVRLPKVLETFAQGASLNPHDLLKWIGNCVKDEMGAFKFQCTIDAMAAKAGRGIEWMHYDTTFHYMFAIPFTKFGNI